MSAPQLDEAYDRVWRAKLAWEAAHAVTERAAEYEQRARVEWDAAWERLREVRAALLAVAPAIQCGYGDRNRAQIAFRGGLVKPSDAP